MSNRQKKYQLISTLGPSVKNKITDLIQAGTTGFRLNCSHASQEEVLCWLAGLERAFQMQGETLPIWLDLQGTKMRIGRLSSASILQRGDIVTFRNGSIQSSKEIPIPHENVFEMAEKGDLVLLDDGRIELSVLEQGEDSFTAEVVAPGQLSSFKGFVMKKCSPELVKVSQRDQAFIEQTKQFKFVGYAISYIQYAKELRPFKDIANGRSIVAKIERKEAFESLKEIADSADALWLCRGDLGVDVSIYDLFSYEKKFIDGIALMNKPVFVAGQILEGMVNHTSPSRSEVAHLGFLMENGFSGVVLSDETAIGKFPILAVRFCSDYLEYMARKCPVS